MLISLEWLSEYVDVGVGPDELAERLALAGLNHEGTHHEGDDAVLDLEITSNRGDLLGHVGVAREVAVLLGGELRMPKLAQTQQKLGHESGGLRVENAMPAGCPRYAARLVRGVKVGPSPDWLIRRLAAVRIPSINNVVDVTNYVLMECGKPTHAFDAAKIRGGKIAVRPGRAGEKMLAIDHREYSLDADTVTIADAQGAIAIGGIMGGLESEVTEATRDVILESALFTPLAIRRTARRLKLASAASYRFERRVDPRSVDWALQRCVDLITELAGGTADPVTLQTNPFEYETQKVTLRSSKITRVLGIEVPWTRTREILTKLGCEVSGDSAANTESGPTCEVVPPSFRSDLTREVDLIEEVARIHGYDKIPEDAVVPTAVSAKRPADAMLERLRGVLLAAGYFEVVTPSCVRDNQAGWLDVWGAGEPLRTITPMLEGASTLRRSVLPSLIGVRLNNQALHSDRVSLFEVAAVYLAGEGRIDEREVVSLASDDFYPAVKGVIEELVEACCGSEMAFQWGAWQADGIEPGTGLQCLAGDQVLGCLGLVSAKLQGKLKLLRPLTVAELDFQTLMAHWRPLPRLTPINPHPPIERDLNFILPESSLWAELSAVIAGIQEPLLQNIRYKETYRDASRDGEGRKRVLLSVLLQGQGQTLTAEQADSAVQRIVSAIESKSGGKLVGGA